MSYHDTPEKSVQDKSLPGMRFIDASPQPGKKHAYRVIAVNSVGLQSQPSAVASAQ